MKKILKAEKLKKGDSIRVLSLAQSLSIVPRNIIKKSEKYFTDLGLNVTYGKNAFKTGLFNSVSIAEKISDLNEAFLDKNIKAIIVSIGGFNSNQLLDNIDWSLIAKNPKIFCGFSDITVLNNAIFEKTGLITYYSPNFFCFGLDPLFKYTNNFFEQCLFEDKIINIESSQKFSDYPWNFNLKHKRKIENNKKWMILNEGKAEGIIIGGNNCSFNLLNNTQYFPKIKDDIILMLEDDDYDSLPMTFERNLQSIIQQPYFNQIKGILIGRFQKQTKFKKEILQSIINSKKELQNIPIIANLDFGHTDPKFTFPIGGRAILISQKNKSSFTIIDH